MVSGYSDDQKGTDYVGVLLAVITAPTLARPQNQNTHNVAKHPSEFSYTRKNHSSERSSIFARFLSSPFYAKDTLFPTIRFEYGDPKIKRAKRYYCRNLIKKPWAFIRVF